MKIDRLPIHVFYIIFLLVTASSNTVLAQENPFITPIEIKGRKVFHQGQSLNLRQLVAVVQEAENEKASQLIGKHKANMTAANILSWTGLGISTIGLIKQLNALSESDPFQKLEQNDEGYLIVGAGVCLTLTGVLIGFSSWKKNGVAAINIYNQLAINGRKKGLSINISPSGEALGVKLGIRF